MEVKYSIDSNKVFITGFSNGAMMAYKVITYLFNKITAAACVSGAMLDTTVIPEKPVAIMHIHGNSDLLVPHDGTTEYGFNIPSIDETFTKWIRWNHCSTVHTILNYDKNVTALKWSGDAEARLFFIHGLGHEWATIKNSGWGATTRIIDFFNKIPGIKQ